MQRKGMGDKKQENSRQVQAEDVHQWAFCLLCAAADTLEGKETKLGRNRLPIKNEEGG